MPKTIPAACGRGHTLNKANTYVDKTGKWHCRPCQRINQAALQQRQYETREGLKQARLANRPVWPVADLAWIAGLFEGEGTVTITSGGRKGYTRSLASVTSTDPETLEPFFRMWPGGERRHTPKGNAREAITWRVEGETMMAFLLDVRPHLRTTRVRAKFDLILEVQALRRRGSRNPNYGTMMLAYRERMRILNHRGTSPLPAGSANGELSIPAA